MSAEILRRAAALMRERVEARKVMPEGASRCDRADHPARLHGHYGYGGRYSCTDFGSPLLSEENMGSRHVYAKPVESPDAFLLAVADCLDAPGCSCPPCSCCGAGMCSDDCEPAESALAVARAYLGEQA